MKNIKFYFILFSNLNEAVDSLEINPNTFSTIYTNESEATPVLLKSVFLSLFLFNLTSAEEVLRSYFILPHKADNSNEYLKFQILSDSGNETAIVFTFCKYQSNIPHTNPEIGCQNQPTITVDIRYLRAELERISTIDREMNDEFHNKNIAGKLVYNFRGVTEYLGSFLNSKGMLQELFPFNGTIISYNTNDSRSKRTNADQFEKNMKMMLVFDISLKYKEFKHDIYEWPINNLNFSELHSYFVWAKDFIDNQIQRDVLLRNQRNNHENQREGVCAQAAKGTVRPSKDNLDNRLLEKYKDNEKISANISFEDREGLNVKPSYRPGEQMNIGVESNIRYETDALIKHTQIELFDSNWDRLFCEQTNSLSSSTGTGMGQTFTELAPEAPGDYFIKATVVLSNGEAYTDLRNFSIR